MKELEKHPNIIQWNPVNSEVTVEGKTLKWSNIVDLIAHVMRSRKTAKAPVHGDAFLKILANLNVPEEFVKNKYQISKFRSYKQNVDDPDDIDVDNDEDEILFRRQQVLRARKQLAAKKRRIRIIYKLPPTKKFKWLNGAYK